MNPITVSRDSWHYRVYRFARDPVPNWVARLVEEPARDEHPQPKAICGYFWTIALSPVLVVLTWLVIAAITVIFGPLALLVMLVMAIKDRHDARVAEHGPSKVTFAASYVKARKARVCPRVFVS